MSSPAIHVQKLGKRFLLGQRAPYRRISELLVSLASAPFRGRVNHGGSSGPAHIWALKDVSFEVPRGKVLGIIGRNGAGKSTLLKILSQITEPTEGRVEIRGRVGSLLEVGTGFHPELTGRENIYLNGAILGMKRPEIRSRFDEIVAFAEIDQFLDTPVKHYSSGMYTRLAFAVAAHLEPEILIMDEVLAVGDFEFQKKCLNKMDDVAQAGRTVLFVSHNMPAILRLCHSTVLLKDGRVESIGQTEDVVDAYLSQNSSRSGEHLWSEGIANAGVTEFAFRGVRIRVEDEISANPDVRKPFTVEVEFEIRERLPYCRVGFNIATANGIVIFATYDSDEEKYAGQRAAGRYVSRCEVPGHLLNPGHHVLSIAAGITNRKTLAVQDNVLKFDVLDTGAAGSELSAKRQGVIRPKLNWECELIP